MRVITSSFHGVVGNFTLDVSFAIPAHGITGIFGPSGCGKTTILRCLSGLMHFKDGYLSVGDVVWQNKNILLPPHKRSVGYVFQEPRLFAHLSVDENLKYGLKRSGTTEQTLTTEQVADLMGIKKFLNRSIYGLSGGEKQRIAIARALLSQPQLLLMDEPLSALDKASRNDILPYLESLHEKLGLPIIYVTHDFSEIERLADHLILMDHGRITASGPLRSLLTDLSLPIARQPEAAMVLDVTLADYDTSFDISLCRAGDIQFQVPGRIGKTGSIHRLKISANDVSLATGEHPVSSTLLNIFPARIIEASTVGTSQMMILLELNNTETPARLLSSVTRKSWQTLNFKPGVQVFAQVKSMALAQAQ